MNARAIPAAERWERLDARRAPQIDWLLAVPTKRVVVLLGAFDPPTNAHVAIAKAAAREIDASAALGMTKVMLDRPDESLLSIPERLALIAAIAEQERFGFFLANRGTYLDVARALVADGWEPTFVVGSDKLDQLADSKFYDDGEAGVASTFSELDLLVVPRAGSTIDRSDVAVLDPARTFADAGGADVSGTEVRRRLRIGEPVDELVPPEVALALRGYTAAR